MMINFNHLISFINFPIKITKISYNIIVLETFMLKFIDITELMNPEKIAFNKAGVVYRNHNPIKKMNKMFNQDLGQVQGINKLIVPIKQYSNKFLRESASKQNDIDKIANKQNRFTSIVNKHKAYQKKYQNVLTRNHYICKTQPNQNQYQCFSTSNNFYEPQQKHVIEKTRVKTGCMMDKHSNGADFNYFEKDQQKDITYIAPLEQDNRSKNKQELPRRDQKISTSRALQLFSKIIFKDKGDLLERMKSCNQKKILKDKMIQSSKNLQAKQMVLLQKQKKFSFAQRGENKVSIKTVSKFHKKKKSNIIHLFEEIQNFQICGWDNPN